MDQYKPTSFNYSITVTVSQLNQDFFKHPKEKAIYLLFKNRLNSSSLKRL